MQCGMNIPLVTRVLWNRRRVKYQGKVFLFQWPYFTARWSFGASCAGGGCEVSYIVESIGVPRGRRTQLLIVCWAL